MRVVAENYEQTHARTHARTHAHTHASTQARTHTHTHTHGTITVTKNSKIHDSAPSVGDSYIQLIAPIAIMYIVI